MGGGFLGDVGFYLGEDEEEPAGEVLDFERELGDEFDGFVEHAAVVEQGEKVLEGERFGGGGSLGSLFGGLEGVDGGGFEGFGGFVVDD